MAKTYFIIVKVIKTILDNYLGKNFKNIMDTSATMVFIMNYETLIKDLLNKYLQNFLFSFF